MPRLELNNIFTISCSKEMRDYCNNNTFSNGTGGLLDLEINDDCNELMVFGCNDEDLTVKDNCLIMWGEIVINFNDDYIADTL